MRAPRPLASLLTGLLLGTGATAAVLAWNPFGWGLVDSRPPNAAETGSAPAEERRILYWRAPMDPSFRSDKPGKSPMGMDLVPVYSGAEADADAPDGTVRVSSGFLQNFAVRTAEARRGAIPVSIRTVGVLAHNEEKLVSVNTKFRGWIEHARVHNVGEHVERGDVLFDIYSPDLVTTQREYLAALEYVERLRDAGAYPETVERARSLREAARERLRYWDMTEAQISQLAESGAAPRTVRFFAPASGFIVEKMGDSLEGLALAPGVTVLKIADHSTLWAQAEFYEEDLRHV
ncbi:MAG: efflux RND transporter periplasmic adaptor subunit, partial [Gammaproteobacteria bacterium]|nr:efflux RND transporter periplasmic adaptor subunit [Gammaproteobacteria bacterium]